MALLHPVNLAIALAASELLRSRRRMFRLLDRILGTAVMGRSNEPAFLKAGHTGARCTSFTRTKANAHNRFSMPARKQLAPARRRRRRNVFFNDRWDFPPTWRNLF